MGVAPSGNQVTFGVQNIYRFRDGKVVERWTNPDLFGLMVQTSGPSGLRGRRCRRRTWRSCGRVYDAWNRRDEEELLALCDPEMEFVNSPTAVEPGTRQGTTNFLPSFGRSGTSCAMAVSRLIESTIAERR